MKMIFTIAIVFLEDIEEAPIALIGMLTQLIQGKTFKKLPDLFLESFKGCDRYPEHKIVYAQGVLWMDQTTRFYLAVLWP